MKNMNNTRTKMRYILKIGDVVVGEATNLTGIADLAGCSMQMIYKTKVGSEFTYGGVKHTIIDKLDLV